jgi:hypothetical protein
MKVEIDGKEFVEKNNDRNTGYRNSGNWNSGNWNSGDWNSGNRNSGNCNSGNWNSGNRNSGDWNSGDCNSGYLNSETQNIRMFNKDTHFKYGDIGKKIIFADYFYFDLTKWIGIKDMTKEEKEQYPHYAVTSGFLRVFKYKDAWKNSFDKATKEDVKKTLNLPNFDYKVFEEITGITKKMIETKLK